MTPMFEGYYACEDGENMEDNPYPHLSQDYKDWQEGFEQCLQDREEDPYWP